jgi:CHAT domain-containing protein
VNSLSVFLQKNLTPESWDQLRKRHPGLISELESSSETSGTDLIADSNGSAVIPDLSPDEVVTAIAVVQDLYRERSLRNLQTMAVAAQLLDCAEKTVLERSQWAEIQFHRGEVTWYRAFEHPDRTEAMIESAIESYHRALTVYTIDDYPYEWAHMLESLSLMYIDRISGNRAQNLATAIHHMNESTRVYTEETYPEQWANMMINLGSVYAQLPRDDTAENIEKGIQCLIRALRVHTRESNPVTWATIQVNLGTAHQHRLRGEPADNIEETIRLYSNALMVFNRETYPERYALLNSNLGNAFVRRVKGAASDNLLEAVHRLETALAVKSDRIPPFHTAMIQHNLANAFIKLNGIGKNTQAETPDWIEQAIVLCDKAMKICRDNYPVEEAMIHASRGNAFQVRQSGNREDNLQQACAAFRSALQVFTPDSMPVENIRKNTDLARVALDLEDPETASEALSQAMSAFDVMYRQTVTRDGQKRAIEEGSPACFLAAYCAAVNGQLPLAVDCLERGRTRALANQLALDRTVFRALAPDRKKAYEQLTTFISGFEYKLQKDGVSRDQYVEWTAELKSHRQQLNHLIESIREEIPGFQRNAVPFTSIQNLIPDNHTALVTFCITDLGTTVMILLHGSLAKNGDSSESTQCFTYPAFSSVDLAVLNRRWLKSCTTLKQSKRHADDIAVFESEVIDMMQTLYDSLFKDTDALLAQQNIRHLIFAPHKTLHVLPLHLMRSRSCNTTPVMDSYLFEKYDVSYVPSLSVLYHLSRPDASPGSEAGTGKGDAQGTDTDMASMRFLGVANPTGDLQFAGMETENAAAFFATSRILAGGDAVPETVLAAASEADYLHFSCHGAFDQDDPDRTGLILARTDSRQKKPGTPVTDPHSSGWIDGMDQSSDRHVFSTDRAVFFHSDSEDMPYPCGTLLSLLDICHQMDLNHAHLVVLSACESGLIITGCVTDEVVGLPAGFLQAGADAVLSSLWLVDDARARDLITTFYRYHRKDGLSPAAALRAAQKHMQMQDTGLYYWGGFVVTGGRGCAARPEQENRR